MQSLSQSQRSIFDAVSTAISTTFVDAELETERRAIFDAVSRTLANAALGTT
jgi:hypothetical protein